MAPGLPTDAVSRYTAPMTRDRAEMISDNKTDLDVSIDEYLRKSVADGMPAVQGKPILVNITALRKALTSDFSESSTVFPALTGHHSRASSGALRSCRLMDPAMPLPISKYNLSSNRTRSPIRFTRFDTKLRYFVISTTSARERIAGVFHARAYSCKH